MTWKNMFLLENVAKHLIHNCEKFQVVWNNVELIDSKVPKVSHFQKDGAYDFEGRGKKGQKILPFLKNWWIYAGNTTDTYSNLPGVISGWGLLANDGTTAATILQTGSTTTRAPDDCGQWTGSSTYNPDLMICIYEGKNYWQLDHCHRKA